MEESIRGNGFAENFWENFKKSKFYEVYKKHADELFIGVRDGYINIYYKCANIAKIYGKKSEIIGELSDAYCGLKGSANIKMTDIGFEKNYDIIKQLVDNVDSNKFEKISQERLVLDNNNNPNSDWYCLDVEYTKSIDKKIQKWRFDIIAISKKAPHRVALIELKYGSGAIGGESGIQKHLDDYKFFIDNNCFEKYLKQEIVNIINIQKDLVIEFPKELNTLEKQNITDKPEIYFITLNNNEVGGSTPKMTMGGYLFPDKRWNSKKNSRKAKDGCSLETMEKIKPTFLFSNTELKVSGMFTKPINDILDEKCYDDVEKIK